MTSSRVENGFQHDIDGAGSPDGHHDIAGG